MIVRKITFPKQMPFDAKTFSCILLQCRGISVLVQTSATYFMTHHPSKISMVVYLPNRSTVVISLQLRIELLLSKSFTRSRQILAILQLGS